MVETKIEKLSSLCGVDMTSLSAELQIATILDEINCAPSNFSEIADLHANSRVIQALKGQNDFSAEDGAYYLDVARQLKRLAEDFPVPISWKETQKIKELLTSRRLATRPIPFAIIIVGMRLFKKISAMGQVETAGDYQSCAAFSDEMLARTAAKILNSLGERQLRVTTITNVRRPVETIVHSLSDLGFQQELAKN